MLRGDSQRAQDWEVCMSSNHVSIYRTSPLSVHPLPFSMSRICTTSSLIVISLGRTKRPHRETSRQLSSLLVLVSHNRAVALPHNAQSKKEKQKHEWIRFIASACCMFLLLTLHSNLLRNSHKDPSKGFWIYLKCLAPASRMGRFSAFPWHMLDYNEALDSCWDVTCGFGRF